MSAQDLFSGGHSHGGSERRRSLAIAAAGATLGLIATLILTQAWLSLNGPTDAAASLPTAPAASPTATDRPTPPPLSFANPSMTWPTYMGTSDRSGYNANETTLGPATVGQLKLRWTQHAGGSVFSQPVAANGLLYWGSWDGYEHATSVATGKDVWTRFLGQTVDLPCEGVAVGVSSTATVAFAPVDGRRKLLVFVGGGDAMFYALDAQTGAVVWKTSLGQPPATYLWSSPAYYQGSIYMGVASLGDCPLVQGQVVRLNAANGKVERVAAMAPDGCVGGTVWGSVTVDQDTGIIYVGTGNQGDCGRDEPYVDAVMALRASDLALLGAWQSPGALAFGDSDFGSTPTLFTAQISGATRKLVGLANKDGNFYAFDAAQVYRGPVWTTRVADVAMCPACGDGGWVPGAWDGKVLYEPGGKTTINGTFCPGGLRALNPANGAVIWATCLPGPTFGALTLGPGFLVIEAGAQMLIVGTQGAATGHILYTFQDPRAPNPWFYSSASIADGVLYFGDADGNLYALGT